MRLIQVKVNFIPAIAGEPAHYRAEILDGFHFPKNRRVFVDSVTLGGIETKIQALAASLRIRDVIRIEAANAIPMMA